MRVECVIVGAGVVGLAVALALQRQGREVVVIEAESKFGQGISSRNSEVIHAGIYYSQGSLKAQLCVRGKSLLYQYSQDKGVDHRRIGKLIVAVDDAEIPTLQKYHDAAARNGVTDLRWVEGAEIRELEPAIRGVKALHSPSTGIIDSHGLMQSLLLDFEAAGGLFIRNTKVLGGRLAAGGFVLFMDDGTEYELEADAVINSAGLRAPDLADAMEGFPKACVPRASYAIGHYYVYPGPAPFNRLVYPVAVKGGLGVHVTLDMGGAVRFGPDVSWRQGIDYTFDASSKGRFIEAIRRYFPDVDESNLQPGYTGIRPKIVGPHEPDADFVIQDWHVHGCRGWVNLFGIESPGLTSSMAIAEEVARRFLDAQS